jgi:hypothetical protein
MFRKQVFLITLGCVEIIIIMVIAKVLFFNNNQIGVLPRIISPTSPNNTGNTSLSSANSSVEWEYKTLIIRYQINSSKNIVNNSCPVYNILEVAQSNSFPPCFAEDSDPELITLLNKLGNEGWELVSFTSTEPHFYTLIFKRAK